MSEDKLNEIIRAIILEVIEVEQISDEQTIKKQQVKLNIINKMNLQDIVENKNDSSNESDLEILINKYIDCIVMTFNVAFGKNWIINILSKLF